MYEYSAYCSAVVDGDIVDLLVDLGFGIKLKQRIRLYGISSPEFCGGSDPRPWQAAVDFLRLAIEGKRVVIRTYKDKEDKYGRILADIFNGPAVSVNRQMLESGLAVAYLGGKRA